jgi:Na+-transporting NADH:ubiquinone oxidoreductase subunit A
LDAKEEYEELGGLNVQTASKEDILAKLLQGGLFANIRMRPCSILANPNHTPSRIFVKALESAPFAPSAEMQIEGYEKEFQAGLLALGKLTPGLVHLVYRQGTDCKAFTEAANVEKHTAAGPHPISNHSVHIHHIDPIEKNNEIVWTLTAYDVLCMGVLLTTGRVHIDRVISIAGTGILSEMRGYYKARAGYPIEKLVDTRNAEGILRYISGDLLNGDQVGVEDFLGFSNNIFCSIKESNDRELLHFFRLGLGKFTASRTYLSGFLKNGSKEYEFTTNQHGEERAFVDGRIYDKVMPMQISTMHLVKAVLAGDFDLAEQLGFLEVDSEDFALPTFICPCKVEMSDIMKTALKDYATEIIQ